MTFLLFSCQPGNESLLLEEIDTTWPNARNTCGGGGWIHCHVPEDVLRSDLFGFAYARQCVPEPVPIAADSVSVCAEAATGALLEDLGSHEGSWRLHIFCSDYPGSPVRASRCRLVEAQVIKRLAKKRRDLLRTRIRPMESPWCGDEVLVQIALEKPDSAWYSVCGPSERKMLMRVISRFPGGLSEVGDFPEAPSRAYRKLLEAQQHFGRLIEAGETCVDLGGSPGGWSYVALEQGASVISVDRSPLRADLMRHERLTFVKGDAFKFRPEFPVDWLLCDVVSYPERSLELIDAWLKERLCRHFCVTIKFKGRPDFGAIQALKATLKQHGAEFRIRHLDHNKNELTVFGEASPSARGGDDCPARQAIIRPSS